MKTILCCLLIFSPLAFSQEFDITPLDGDLDFTSLDKDIKVKSPAEKARKNYLSPIERDKVLEKHLLVHIKNMDSFDRDILYKSIISYEDDVLIKKYSFLRQVDLRRLKNDLR